MLRFYRNDGSTSPATAESIELADDGAFTGWRTVAPVVGWFAGSVTSDRMVGLRAAVDAVATTSALPPPGSSVETLDVPGRDPLVVTGVDAAEPLRELLDEMVASPRSAVGLDGRRLVHRGSEPLTLDLSTVVVRAVHWRGYYEPAGDASEVIAADRIEAGPGWSLELPPLPPPPGDDITTHLTVDLAIVADGTAVPVQVQHLPAIAEPPA